MLNKSEEALLRTIIEVMEGFSEIAGESLVENSNLEKYSGDNAELCYHIHALQNWVLANAAARDQPEQYRPFGCKFKKKT